MATQKRKTKFNSDWRSLLNDSNEKFGLWLKKGSSDYFGYCALCRTEFAVDKAGISQVKSHEKSEKHKKRMKEQQSNTLIGGGFVLDEGSMDSGELTMKAEIIWLLKEAKNDIPFLANFGCSSTLAAMFPDSAIAQRIRISPAKSSYVIRFGIGPHCRDMLDKDVGAAVGYSLMFDETTSVQVVKQMDLLVRYWSESADEIVTRFMDSLQFGHAPAEKVVRELLDVIDNHNLQLQKMITCGRDGPNVNKKIMRLLDQNRCEKGGSKLVDVGPCILHVVHNGFRAGFVVFERVEDLIVDLNEWFNTSYSACRREDYELIQIEEVVNRHVLLKHANTRWLTLKPAIERLQEQWPALVKYFSTLEKQKSERYTRIRRTLDDPTTPAKLAFISQMSTDFCSFETMFQANEPMVHRLFESYVQLLRNHAGKFVAAEEMQKKVSEMDVEKTVPLNDMVIGYDTKKLFQSLTMPREKVFSFLSVTVT